MLLTGEKELNKLLKAQVPAGVFLLYGGDSYLVERYCGLLTDRAVGEDRGINYEKISGEKPDFDHLYDSVLTLPMMAERRVVVLDDPNIDAYSAADLDKLLAIVADTEDPALLLIAIKQNPFQPRKSSKCRKLQEAVAKTGTVVELSERTAADLAKQVVKRCEAHGCIISRENADLLVARTSGELIAVENEADKVIAFTGSGEITEEAILRLVSATVEAEVFSLSKAILQKNYARAQKTLSDLLYLREEPVNILYVLSMSFVDLYRAKTAANAAIESGKMSADFGYKGRDFAVRNAFRDSRKLSLRFLREALEILTRADYELKNSPVDGKIILQRTLTELFVRLEESAG